MYACVPNRLDKTQLYLLVVREGSAWGFDKHGYTIGVDIKWIWNKLLNIFYYFDPPPHPPMLIHFSQTMCQQKTNKQNKTKQKERKKKQKQESTCKFHSAWNSVELILNAASYK